MAKKKQKKAKKSCCGKFRKKGKTCSRCPIKTAQKCAEVTEARAKGNKAKKKKKKGKKKKA